VQRRLTGEVIVKNSHITNLEFSMVANLGFYLLVMQAMDSVSIAAASV
jgi:hypothetical protein